MFFKSYPGDSNVPSDGEPCTQQGIACCVSVELERLWKCFVTGWFKILGLSAWLLTNEAFRVPEFSR